MTWDLALDILLDALKDSGLVFAFVFLIHFILSFIDTKFANFLVKRKKSGPVFGALFGLIPQCGTSVLGADLYLKKYITIGTLSAIFLSCSDEAVVEILVSGVPEKMLMVIPLIASKFFIGALAGFLIDLFYKKQEKVEVDEVEEEKECHHHHHEVENSKIHKHLVHPLLHSLEIFAYVLVINLALGFLIGFVGEENFKNFITMNKYLSPLFASIIGLIPNCASSLLLAELFVGSNIGFGALLGGLLVNAGLGMMVLIKNKKEWKNTLLIFGLCFAISLVAGYLASTIEWLVA